MQDNKNDVLYSVLGYFGILVLVPILAGKDSEFCKFHANQGLILLIGEIAASVLSALGGVIFLFGLIAGLLSLVCLVFAIIGIIGAAKHEMNPLPVIGGIRLLK